jgi:hypothetical protein
MPLLLSSDWAFLSANLKAENEHHAGEKDVSNDRAARERVCHGLRSRNARLVFVPVDQSVL